NLKSQIDDRDRLVREREAAEARAANRPGDKAAKPEEKKSVAPWVVTGVGVAAVGAGVVFGLLASSKHDAATTEPVQTTANAEQSQAKTFATIADVSIIAGGAIAAGGLVWGLLSLRSGDKTDRGSARVTPILSPVVAPGSYTARTGAFAGIDVVLP